MPRSRNFCQFYLVLSLFYSLKRGSNSLIAEKTTLILYKGSKGGPLFSGGGGGGGGGGECPEPLSPLQSAHGQCHHNGTIFITVRPLTIIVRH